MLAVEVSVLEARGLVEVAKSPFVCVRPLDDPLSKEAVKKTGRAPKSLAPQWLSTFVFEEVPRSAMLAFEVMDYVGALSKTKLLGRATLAAEVEDERWLPLLPGGELKVRVERKKSDSWFAEEEIDEGKEVNCLLVAVVRARGLRATDRTVFGKATSSDPFVVLDFGAGDTQKTKVHKKNLDPVFRETFRMPLSSADVASLDPQKKITLRARVFDEDLVTSELIGEALIPCVLPTTRGPAEAKWFGLTHEKRRTENPRDCGELELATKLVYDVAFDPMEATRHFFASSSKSEEDSSPNLLQVAVCRCRGLAKNLRGSTYCKVFLEETSLQQKTATKTAPIFDECFSFEIDGAAIRQHQKSAPSTLRVQVYKHDLITSDALLGTAAIDLAPFVRREGESTNNEQWYPLVVDGEKDERGQVLVVAQCRYDCDLIFDPFSGYDKTTQAAPANELKVALFKGRGLASIAGGWDSFLSVDVDFEVRSMSEEVFRWTSTAQKFGSKGEDILWREQYAGKPLAPEEDLGGHHELRVTCSAINAKLGRKKLIGVCTIHLETELFLSRTGASAEPLSRWFRLEKPAAKKSEYLGELFLSVAWQYNRALDYLPPFCGGEILDQSKDPNELCVALVQGKNISIDAQVALAQPVVKFEARRGQSQDYLLRKTEAGSLLQTQTSAVGTQSTSPLWRESFSMMIAPLAEPVMPLLRAICFDRGGCQVGQVDIDLADVMRDRRIHRNWYTLIGSNGVVSPPPQIELFLLWRYNADHDLAVQPVKEEEKEKALETEVVHTSPSAPSPEEKLLADNLVEAAASKKKAYYFADEKFEGPVRLRPYDERAFLAATAGKCTELRGILGPPETASVNERRSRHGRTLLHEAASAGQEAVVRLLVEVYGANVDCRSLIGRETPLHFAVKDSRRRIAFLLLDCYGAQPDLPNKSGLRPLHYVTQLSIARLLLRHGARANALDAKGRNPLECALETLSFSSSEEQHTTADARLLEELKTALNTRDREQYVGRIQDDRDKQKTYEEAIRLRLEAKAQEAQRLEMEDLRARYLAWRNGALTGNQVLEARNKKRELLERQQRLEARFKELSRLEEKQRTTLGTITAEKGDASQNPRQAEITRRFSAVATAAFVSPSATGAMPASITDTLQWRTKDDAKRRRYSASSTVPPASRNQQKSARPQPADDDGSEDSFAA